MSLIQKIKADQLEARKTGSTRLASILTTLIGEADMIGFNDGKRESTDLEVVSVLKKFHANSIANADLFNKETDEAQIIRQSYLDESIVYEKYLPKQLTEDEILSYAIQYHLHDKPDAKKGDFMKYFKENFAGLYDGKVVNSVVDKLIGK